MSIEQLAETAQAMVASGKGIIAIDESAGTIAKRFSSVGIENIEENRRAYRELLLTTPKLSDYISGAILFDETIRQSTKAGVPFPKYMADHGIIPGIKVDKGAYPLAGCPGELVTEGWMGCVHDWRSITSLAHVLPSGVLLSTLVMIFRQGCASMPMYTR